VKKFLIFFLVIASLAYSRIEAAEPFIPEIGRSGGRLVLATISDPKSFNPILAKETSTTVITSLIFEGLTRTDGVTTEVKPSLAERWEVDSEGLKWTFHLRKGVRWSDGRLFTADDVLFTFNQLIYNPDIPNSARDIFTIEGEEFKVERVDELTVTFKLPLKFAPFLRSMSQAILPRHVLQEAVDKGEFNFTWGVDAEPEDIVGTGPFVLSNYLAGQRVILKKNPNYWGKDRAGNQLPYLNEIVYLIVQNQDVSLLKFQEGTLDSYNLRGSDYPILKPKEREADFTIYNAGPAFGTNFLVFNLNPNKSEKTGKYFVEPKKLKWFTNLKFRQAVAYAIDKQSIIDIVMNGLGYPQYSSMSPSAGFFYNPNVAKRWYNPGKAKTILEEAGFKDTDGDGILEDEEGNPLEFNLITNSGNTVRVMIAGIIRKDLENIGIKIHFTQLEFNNLVAKLDSTFDWEAVILGLTGGIEPHFGSNVWQSSGHLHLWYPNQNRPATRWEAKIDEIFDKAVQELDPIKRKRLYDQWQEIVADKLPLIYTVLPASISAVRNKFGNLYPTSYGGTFHNIEEIFIKAPYD
jgi:peptide/nickel transport system substrate-binding protein